MHFSQSLCYNRAMTERIQKILSAAGVCSRREAERLIVEGRVRVNGRIAALGESADAESDAIWLDGKPITKIQNTMTVLLHKPAGYVTTMKDERDRKTVEMLVRDAGVRLYPVGRLDINSSGALLMTNDGELANAMMHPRNQVDKIYHVTVRGDLDTALPILRAPAMMDGTRTAPARVRRLHETPFGTVLEMTIHEGKNRQIRRLCELADLKVTRLARVAIGKIRLGTLEPGAFRALREDEQQYIQTITGKNGGL